MRVEDADIDYLRNNLQKDKVFELLQEEKKNKAGKNSKREPTMSEIRTKQNHFLKNALKTNYPLFHAWPQLLKRVLKVFIAACVLNIIMNFSLTNI